VGVEAGVEEVPFGAEGVVAQMIFRPSL